MSTDSIINLLDYRKFGSDVVLAEKIMRWLMADRGGYTYREVLRIAENDCGRHMSDRRIRQVQKKYGYEEVERVFKDNGKLNYIRYRLLGTTPIRSTPPIQCQHDESRPSWVYD